MTGKDQISNSFITETITACLQEPGTVVAKLYRSDGITQSAPFDQLFANFYRVEPYEFFTSTAHKESLNAINQYFIDLKNELEDCTAEIAPSIDYQNRCQKLIANFLTLLDQCVQEYGSEVRRGMAELEDEDVMELLLTTYNSYAAFVVIMEDKLPAVSVLLEVPSNVYPNSLWKCLFNLFVKHMIMPLEGQLREILVRGIEKLRRNEVKKIPQSTSLNFQFFNNVCSLREIATLLNIRKLNEQTVHFLESSEHFADETLEQMIKAQTLALYTQWHNLNYPNSWEAILLKDVGVLEKTLLPGQAFNLMIHCLNTVRAIWGVEQAQMDKKLETYSCKNIEVELYARKLGIA